MEAGSDTTASTILSFVLAMLKHPEILKKAQEEVDKVCGISRSPTSDDINCLPFLRACMEEVNTFTGYTPDLSINQMFRRYDGVLWPPAAFHIC